MDKKELNKLNLDAADAYSENPDTAEEYLLSEGVDIEWYIKKGFDDLNLPFSTSKKQLTKSQSFFHRVVLAARIVDEYHNERTFGSVKFQKVLYLCENSSRMSLTTHYTKQAAGPMDNRFIYKVRNEFEKQGWFRVQKTGSGKLSKVDFIPLENAGGYKKYYERYYSETDEPITHLINIFRRWKTKDVELVATIFSCMNELNKEGSQTSEDNIVKRVYDWHKEKAKYSEDDILCCYRWMEENRITPKT